MSERDEIYLQILRFGLISLRAAAWSGNAAYCAVEADHLHNIPSLVGETNEHRHEYYFNAERTSYLERVERSDGELGFALRRYEELWPQLQALNKKCSESSDS